MQRDAVKLLTLASEITTGQSMTATSLTKDDVLKAIVRDAISKYDKTYGIMFSTGQRAQFAKNEMLNLIATVPEWLLPGLRKESFKELAWENGNRVIFLNSVSECRGRNFECLFESLSLTEKQKTEFSFVVIPAIASKRPVIQFHED